MSEHALDKPDLATRLLVWYDAHGRHDLPWQREATPYRVWVSEIMLQQTRVSAVIPYFERFVRRFPDVAGLARAPLDEVLALWAGLGYYARARNLHAAARVVMEQHGGVFPDDYESLSGLPGVGASTAAAIAALSAGRRHAILDGNVRRVLARLYRVAGWPGRAATDKRLWALAERHTPEERVAAYTQAIMDLGATVCTRGRPACHACPVADLCDARAAGEQGDYPRPKPRPQRPLRRTRMLLVLNDAGEVLLQRRPPAGVWGGLWGLPEPREGESPEDWCRRELGCGGEVIEAWDAREHGFSHFRLRITPVLVRLAGRPEAVMEAPGRVWYNSRRAARHGVAAPVARLLKLVSTHAPHEGERNGTHG